MGQEDTRKKEGLQAVIRPGTVGFYSFNSIALSSVFHQQSACIVGGEAQEFLASLRNQPAFKVDGKEVSLSKQVYQGITDAFYRGFLPEVLVLTGTVLELPAFIEEYMGFLEKLCSLGFLLQDDSEEQAKVDQYVPQVVIASYGIGYSVLMDKLFQFLENLRDMSPRTKAKIGQKFSRGAFALDYPWFVQQYPECHLIAEPLQMRLAGPKSKYTLSVSHCLQTAKIPVEFNPNGELAILELELNGAFCHLSKHFLPALKLSTHQKTLKQVFETLAKEQGILPGLVTADTALLPYKAFKNYQVSALDMAMLHQLLAMGKKFQADSLITLVKEWIGIVEIQLAEVSSV